MFALAGGFFNAPVRGVCFGAVFSGAFSLHSFSGAFYVSFFSRAFSVSSFAGASSVCCFAGSFPVQSIVGYFCVHSFSLASSPRAFAVVFALQFLAPLFPSVHSRYFPRAFLCGGFSFALFYGDFLRALFCGVLFRALFCRGFFRLYFRKVFWVLSSSLPRGFFKFLLAFWPGDFFACSFQLKDFCVLPLVVSSTVLCFVGAFPLQFSSWDFPVWSLTELFTCAFLQCFFRALFRVCSFAVRYFCASFRGGYFCAHYKAMGVI